MSVLNSILGWFSDTLARVIRSLFHPITTYHINPDVLIRARSFALQTHPKEMIALLAGHHEGSTLVVDELVFQPFENTEHSATIVISHGLTGIVGTFHSHPVPDDRPSAADKRLFAEHPGVHLIAAYPYDSVAVYSHRSRFLARETVPKRPQRTVHSKAVSLRSMETSFQREARVTRQGR